MTLLICQGCTEAARELQDPGAGCDAGAGAFFVSQNACLFSSPVAHPLMPLRVFSRCWLLRRKGSYNVLDSPGQQQVPGRRGVDVAGPVRKLDPQARRACIAPEG